MNTWLHPSGFISQINKVNFFSESSSSFDELYFYNSLYVKQLQIFNKSLIWQEKVTGVIYE